MSFILALKITLVPVLICVVTLAGRRWGPAVAGWLSAFPVVSAPILFFIALDQGAAFAAEAAAATLSAVLAILVFGICYARAALRYAWTVSAATGLIFYFTTVAFLNAWAPTLPTASIAVVIALLIAPYLYPPPPAAESKALKPVSLPLDIGLRMAAGAVLVLLVTQFSANLGPRLSGLFAMFPVIGSVLAIFSHRASGASFTIHLLRGMVLGYYAFACFCFVLATVLPHLNIATAFGLSLVAGVLVQAATRMYQMRMT